MAGIGARGRCATISARHIHFHTPRWRRVASQQKPLGACALE
jgi:hypothetical protein